MTTTILTRMYEHNNWANEQIIQICAGLSDEQLDAEPPSAAYGSIRSTLAHMAAAQENYLSLLTIPLEQRQRRTIPLDFAEVQPVTARSGAGLLALARGDSETPMLDSIRSKDGWVINPWVVMVQVINHATEHREQVNSALSALGITPPELDGWAYGEAAGGAFPAPE
jgi:uncharacterized damage-inducible protein DinB